MFRIKIDSSELKRVRGQLGSVRDIDAQNAVNWYLAQVYRASYRKHSKNYTYTTPPAYERINLRKRSGNLLNQLKNSRYSSVTGTTVSGGFAIPKGNPKGSYLGIHVDDTIGGSKPAYRMRPREAKHTYTTAKGEQRILIPLAAAQGKPIPRKLSARQQRDLIALPFKIAEKRASFAGENKRFHANAVIVLKKSGRRYIPMYLIAKTAKIPRRLKLAKLMHDNQKELHNRLEVLVNREIARVTKKRTR